MVGRATLRMVLSIPMTSRLKHRTARVHQRRAWTRSAANAVSVSFPVRTSALVIVVAVVPCGPLVTGGFLLNYGMVAFRFRVCRDHFRNATVSEVAFGTPSGAG